MNTLRSVEQTAAHHSRSDRYVQVSTSDIMATFADHGWYPTRMQEKRVLKEDRRGFQSHIVRLGHDDYTIGPDRLEVVIANAHDGTRRLRLAAGILRTACLNGLIAGDLYGDYRIRHNNQNILEDLSGAITSMQKSLPLLAANASKMQTIELDYDGVTWFCSESEKMRQEVTGSAIKLDNPRNLNIARRSLDRGDTLWNVFNRVQENMIKGGVRGRNDLGQRRTIRQVNNIDLNIKLNQGLFNLADHALTQFC